jgi:hypothetical protein
MNNTIDYTALVGSDLAMLTTLIENGEWDRALSWAGMVMTSIKGVMRENGIEPSRMFINGVEIPR